MKQKKNIFLLLFLLIFTGCITQFIPETDEDKDLLVVEGLITDQPGINTIKISKSLPLGSKTASKPLKGCIVTISDDTGNTFKLKETVSGTYVTDPLQFTGRIGRFYTLHIKTISGGSDQNFESYPVEMRAVPPIDSVYYKKIAIREGDELRQEAEGCQVLLFFI